MSNYAERLVEEVRAALGDENKVAAGKQLAYLLGYSENLNIVKAVPHHFRFLAERAHDALDAIGLYMLSSDDYAWALVAPYSKYLRTNVWRARSLIVRNYYGWKCMMCGVSEARTEYLVSHHNNYKNRGNEKFTDLVCICKGCHQRHHANERQIEQFAKEMLSWVNHV